jgi:hypothetical protein
LPVRLIITQQSSQTQEFQRRVPIPRPLDPVIFPLEFCRKQTQNLVVRRVEVNLFRDVVEVLYCYETELAGNWLYVIVEIDAVFTAYDRH